MTDDELKTLHEIVVAGYLHDIGKFAQRAGVEKYRSNREEQLCPSHEGGWHSHQHVLYTDGALTALKDSLPDGVDCPNIIELAASHHRPSTFEEWCVAEGDRLSSGMDRRSELDIESEHGKKFYEKPLVSLLSTLQIDGRETPNETYQKLVSLEGDAIFGSESAKISKDDYAKLWTQFETDFKQLQGLHYDDFINALDALLLRYLWCIPSSTIDDADISLYQHAKTTTAFAGALYRYHVEHGDKNEASVQNRNEPKFLFVNGDISGIQKYIFDLKSTDNSAKLLRAKSFELMALSQIFAENLVKEFGGSIADIITSSGGKFQVLLPLTAKVEEKLPVIQTEYESYFLEEFAGKLAVIISGGTKASGDDLCGKENVRNLINRIGYDGDCAKQKKMQKALAKNGHVLEKLYAELQANGECPCCGIYASPSVDAEGNKEPCRNCEKLVEIGGRLVRSAGIQYKSDKILHFGQMVNFADNAKGEVIEKTFSSINTYVPGRGLLNLPYIAPWRDTDKRELKTFEEIADVRKNGNNKLAMFKADIDNLGLVFTSSLGNRMSFSRYADMSRIFHYFFSAYYVDFVENHYKDKIYTVFSGGDDLCVIGNWKDIMQFAADFHKEVEKLTNRNKSVTLSAGIALFSSNVPLGFVAEDAEAQLEKSKGREIEAVDAKTGRKETKTLKNAITVFGTTVSWDEYDRCLADGARFEQVLAEGTPEAERLSTAVVYKMLDFAERAKSLEKGNLRDLMWKSNFRYMATRNLSKASPELKKWFLDFGADDTKMKQSKIAVSYGLYTQRGKERHDAGEE